MSVREDPPEGVTYGSRRVARVDAQPPDGGKGLCSTPEGSRISMSDSGIAKVSATPAGVGMVGPADRWLLAGARNHRLPYATPFGVDTAGHSFTGSCTQRLHLRSRNEPQRPAAQAVNVFAVLSLGEQGELVHA